MMACVGLEKTSKPTFRDGASQQHGDFKMLENPRADGPRVKLSRADLAAVRPLIQIAAPRIQRFSIPRGGRVLR